MTVHEINSGSEFDFEIENNKEVLSIVYYYANASEACAILGPMVDEISNEVVKAKFYKVDVAKHTELLTSYGIESVPSFIVFRNSKKLGHLVETDPVTARSAIVHLVTEYS